MLEGAGLLKVADVIVVMKPTANCQIYSHAGISQLPLPEAAMQKPANIHT
jgi:hypothetical protein